MSAIAQDRPALDVVSIREDRLVAQFIPKTVEFHPGRLRIAHYSVEDLVARAYGVRQIRDLLIVGWPDTGIRDKRFDVVATLLNADGPITAEEQRRIILEVLTTRFSFKAHTESRLVDAYRLRLVKPGVLGRGLRRVDFNCAEIPRSAAPKDQNGRSLCGFGELRYGGMIRRGSGTISVLLEELTSKISFREDRVIVDGTGLQGFFVWDYEYGPDMGSFTGTVLPDQLGLRLEPAQVRLDVVVIDDIRMPTPN